MPAWLSRIRQCTELLKRWFSCGSIPGQTYVFFIFFFDKSIQTLILCFGGLGPQGRMPP